VPITDARAAAECEKEYMSADANRGERPSLRDERDRRAGGTARRLDLVIAALRERPADRVRRLHAGEAQRPAGQTAKSRP
jgi:hypothetical protein